MNSRPYFYLLYKIISSPNLWIVTTSEDVDYLYDKIDNVNHNEKVRDLKLKNEDTNDLVDLKNDNLDELISINPNNLKDESLSEVILEVSDIDNDLIDLKKPQEVYLEIYKNSLIKAKELRKAALESYMELKNIKEKYNLHKYIESEDELSDYAELE